MGLGVLMPVLLENKVGITASILLGSTFIPITALALLEVNLDIMDQLESLLPF